MHRYACTYGIRMLLIVVSPGLSFAAPNWNHTISCDVLEACVRDWHEHASLEEHVC